MDKALIIISIFLIGCKQEVKKEFPLCNLLPIPYDILYKENIKIKENNFTIGIVQFKNFSPDSIIYYCGIYQSAVKISIIEGLSYAEFYDNLALPNDTVAILGRRTGIHGNSYIGKLDLIKYGANWKEKISEKEFQYYNPRNMPIMIKPKIPVLE